MAVDTSCGRERGALTLVDTEFYTSLDSMALTVARPSDGWRETKFLPWMLNRDALLREVGVSNFCRDIEDVCAVWHRGTEWIAGWQELAHGDYPTVLQRNLHIPLKVQWQFAQERDDDLMQAGN